ncbi:MAG: type 11 methyltransferase [Anaerolineaceae bacterium]|nr:MAG: type 11 methyltransferase [Anaerolineaceae bacterium]
MKKSLIRSVWDFLGIPFRLVLLDQAWLPKLGWTTLEEERIQAVLPHLEGRLLDVGAGTNLLVKTYGNGLGVDVFEWGGGAQVVEDTSNLPFEPACFDSITFIACLNHIPYRDAALREARRLIRPGGRLVITMISPLLGNVGHAIWWYSEDKRRGGMLPGELGGMTTRQIVRLCREAGFALTVHKRFVYGMNNLYVFEPV